MTQQPTHQWTATTVEEALSLLAAARKQLEARMLALVPGDVMERIRAGRTAPVRLTITLDDTDLNRQVADQHVFLRQVRGDSH